MFTEYLTIKRANFDTIVSFLSRHTLLRKRIEDTKFKIDDNFELTFFYNAIKAAYPIKAKYWAAALEGKELDIGTFLSKLSNIGNVKSYTSIDVNV